MRIVPGYFKSIIISLFCPLYEVDPLVCPNCSGRMRIITARTKREPPPASPAAPPEITLDYSAAAAARRGSRSYSGIPNR